jgi:hypothetical protein
MLDLKGARLKIERAKKHIADLDAERLAFLGSKDYFGVPKFNPAEDHTVFVLEELPAIPASVGAILGDAAHNLRTSLDYLACELVRSAGNEPGGGVYFPISNSVREYEAESGGKTKGIPEEAKKIIDAIHPYFGGNNVLWSLHQLDRVDKHRLVLTVAMRVGRWGINLTSEPTEISMAFPTPLEKGDVIGWVAGNHEVDRQMSVTADITFGEPEILQGRPMIETLGEMVQVVEAVIGYFETHYPPSDGS